MAVTLDARVQQKTATEASWLANPLVLLNGEQAFVINSEGQPINFKIGDGTKTFAQLPYVVEFSQILIEEAPAPGGTLPEPDAAGRLIVLPAGTYTQPDSSTLIAPDDSFSVYFWDGDKWSLNLSIPISFDPTGLATEEELNDATTMNEYIQVGTSEGGVVVSYQDYTRAIVGGLDTPAKLDYVTCEFALATPGTYGVSVKIFEGAGASKKLINQINSSPLTDGVNTFTATQLGIADYVFETGYTIAFRDNSTNSGFRFTSISGKPGWRYSGNANVIGNTYTFESVNERLNAVAYFKKQVSLKDAVSELTMETTVGLTTLNTKVSSIESQLKGPPTYITQTGTPEASEGYYNLTTGAFVPLANRFARRYTGIDATKEYTASGVMQGALSALVSYYGGSGSYLGFEFPGGSSSVTYTNQLLTLPVGTTEIRTVGIGAYTSLFQSKYDGVANKKDIYDGLCNTKDKNMGVSGDSITAATQSNRWVNICATSLQVNMSTLHNTAIGSAVISKRTGTFSGVTITTQNYDDPSFKGFSDGFSPTTDPVEMQKRYNNCAVVHLQKFISEVDAGTFPVPDIFVFSYGTNPDLVDGTITDAKLSQRTAVDRDADTFTMWGAIRWCLDTLKRKWPTIKIFVSVPIQSGRADKNTRNSTIVSPALKTVANALGITVIDAYNESGICYYLEQETTEGEDLSDGVHPNSRGGRKQGKFMAREIRKGFTII